MTDFRAQFKDAVEGSGDSYHVKKVTPFALNVRYSNSCSGIYHTYDFASRLLITVTSSSGASPQVIPFSQLDPESLEGWREKLIALDGTPPALPVADKPGSIFPSKGL